MISRQVGGRGYDGLFVADTDDDKTATYNAAVDTDDDD
jgi:hypothetical protein